MKTKGFLSAEIFRALCEFDSVWFVVNSSMIEKVLFDFEEFSAVVEVTSEWSV
jgi:hypothetical protein